MRAGAKLGILVAALAAAVGVVFLLAGGVETETEVASSPDVAPEPAQVPTSVAKPPRTDRQRQAKSKRSEAELEPTSKAALEDFRLLGRVVEGEETPVAGAIVRAVRLGSTTDEARTGADGRFALRCGRRPASGAVTLGVTASLGAARAAFVAFELSDDAAAEDDLGDVALEKAVPLVARVVDAKGPVAGAEVFLGSFFGTVFAKATADARGVAKFETSPASDAWLFAYAKGRGRARGEIPDGRDPAVPLILTLTSRTVVVSVVRTPPDVPLAGERVGARIVTEPDDARYYTSFVPPVELAPTGPDGTTRIEDVAELDALELKRLSSDATSPAWRYDGLRAKLADVEPRATEARIEVPAGRTIRWRVVAGEVPTPPEGAIVKLRAAGSGSLPTGPSALKMEGGELVGSGFEVGRVQGVAETDDGAVAALFAERILERGVDAVFQRPRRIDVTLREESGAPVAGAELTLSNGGDPVRTDSSGRAAFVGLEPSVVNVAVVAKSSSPADVRSIGSVDLSKGDGKLDARLPAPRTVVLRVTTEGGRTVPPVIRVFIDRTEINASADAAADIRVEARPHAADGSLHVLARSDGFRDVEFDVPASASTAELAFDRGVTVLADVRPASGRQRGATLQRWDDARKEWAEQAGNSSSFDRLPPGRYRLYDAATRSSSPAIDVALGDAPPTLTLDLSRSGYAGGRVLGPDDQPVADAWIEVEDDSVSQGVRVRVAHTDAAGVFSVLVPGDRSVRVRAGHAIFRQDPERSVVDVVAPRDDIVLRLVAGPVLEFTLPAHCSALYVQLYRGRLDGRPAAQLDPVNAGSRCRVGGFEPGRYTVFIDPYFQDAAGGGVPLTLFDVELKDGSTDLGDLKPARGSTVRVRVAPTPGEAPRRVTVQFTRTDGIKYARVGGASGGDIVVPGLGAGRFEMVVDGRRAGPSAPPRTIDVDGEHDLVVDYPAK